jgi:guanosine-3',5'-bis(diphosphate) 3'-pyrophosphohydrolase
MGLPESCPDGRHADVSVIRGDLADGAIGKTGPDFHPCAIRGRPRRRGIALSSVDPNITTVDNDPQALLLEAVAFAAEKHRNQRRKDEDASPYINHPIALASLLKREGVDDVAVLCAALLHDTIEDTETTAGELRARFGDLVTSIVLEVTDDRNLDKAERKRLQVAHAHELSARARLVKLADKICNVHDIVAAPPANWTVARKREYLEWAKDVVDRVRGTHPGLEAIFDDVYAEGVRALES